MYRAHLEVSLFDWTTHIGAQTMSDVSVMVNDPTRQGRMVSYVQLLSDQVFASYMARGLSSRDDAVIPRAERDANPLTCQGETFVGTDPLEPWVVLQ